MHFILLEIEAITPIYSCHKTISTINKLLTYEFCMTSCNLTLMCMTNNYFKFICFIMYICFRSSLINI